jgi:hypothetical protein
MAEQHGNRWYPTYYNVGTKRILLRSDWTWQENVWHFINITVGIWLAKAKVWSYDRELIEELEQTCKLRTYLRLKDIVHRGLYARHLSFYLNCRSCAWAAVSNVIYLWQQYAVEIPALTVDIDTPITGPGVKSDDLSLADTLTTHNTPKLRTRYDMINDVQIKRGVGTKTLDDVTRGTVGYKAVWYAVTEAEWDYYLQSCEEFNIQPISKEEFLEKNFPPSKMTDRERKFYKAQWQSDYRKKKEQG